MKANPTKSRSGLWHRDFWLLSFSNLLLCASVAMLLPTLPKELMFHDGLSAEETGVVMALFGAGLFVTGPWCSYLVRRYRRNWVCILSIVALAALMVVPVCVPVRAFVPAALLRFAQGAAFGLAQMVLTSTLVIDTAESRQRTEANHSVTWFGRLALSLGPLAGLIAVAEGGFPMVGWVAGGCALLSAVLILLIEIPFRVPIDERGVVSLDRFFLPKGWPLFVNLVMVTTAAGLLLAQNLSLHFYGTMMAGFLLALFSQQFVFRNAELKSEVVAGLVLMAAALMVFLAMPQSPLCAPLFSLGLGVVGARFLLFFIRLSHHCQRGTSQSTFILGWESGLALGFALAYGLFADRQQEAVFSALSLVVAGLVLYVVFSHSWFLRNKNR